MRIFIFLFFIVSLALLSCAESKKEEKKENSLDYSSPGIEPKTEKKEIIPEKQCFLYVKGKDTVSLTTEQKKDKITGKLVYDLFEKDRNQGEISGVLKGDTIFADYQFTAEGKTSTREVVFLKKEDYVLEGQAEVIQKDGKTIFKSDVPITFNSFKLNRTDCN